MDGLALPCPECNWLNPIVNYGGQGEGVIKYKIRCTKCGWHGHLELGARFIKTGEAETEN